MSTVRQILEAKAQGLLTVTPDATVYDALRTMSDHDVGALVVLAGNRLAGMFSERDYARKVILLGKTSRETRVHEVMVSDVLYVRPDHTCDQCMALMTEKRTRHLPVLEGDRVVGIVSIGDVVKEVISEQQFVISELEHYLRG